MWLASILVERWKVSRLREDERDAHLGERLFNSLTLIHKTQRHVSSAYSRPNGDFARAYSSMGTMEERLQELGIPYPTAEDVNYDGSLACIEWDGYLDRLIPLAAEANIRKARRLKSSYPTRWQRWKWWLQGLLARLRRRCGLWLRNLRRQDHLGE